MQPLTVAVFMGGPSGEHDISLKSGHGVMEALSQRGYRTEAVVIPRQLSIPEACDMAIASVNGRSSAVAFLALHGPFGEDGIIQQLCETHGIPYTGSDAQASQLGMDKVASRLQFEAAGLAVPRWCVLDTTAGSCSEQGTLQGFSYPRIVKPTAQGSSLGVSKVHRPEDMPEAIARASQYGASVLVEEFVRGREVTAGVLGDEALPIVEIRSHHAFFDFQAKYTAGLTDYLVPAPLSDEVTRAVQAAGLAAHRALGCRHLSRADIILADDGRPIVLEINTIPGFTPTSLLPKAAAHIGISYQDLCERLVRMAWQETEHVVRAGSSA